MKNYVILRHQTGKNVASTPDFFSGFKLVAGNKLENGRFRLNWIIPPIPIFSADFPLLVDRHEAEETIQRLSQEPDMIDVRTSYEILEVR